MLLAGVLALYIQHMVAVVPERGATQDIVVKGVGLAEQQVQPQQRAVGVADVDFLAHVGTVVLGHEGEDFLTDIAAVGFGLAIGTIALGRVGVSS